MDYIKSFDRIDDLFSVGRPFVKDCLDYDIGDFDGRLSFDIYTEKDIFQSIDLRLLFSKICTGGTVSWKTSTFELNNHIYFSILGFSVGLSSFPTKISIEELVEKNLMTLIEINENGRNRVASFLPEGPLNAVASWYLCKYWTEFVKPIRSMAECGICDTGDFGEFVARIILLCCAFFTADPRLKFEDKVTALEVTEPTKEETSTKVPVLTMVRQFMLIPQELKSFLVNLTGDESLVEEYFAKNPGLEGSKVNFSYFQPFISRIEDPFDAMMRCYINGSAAILKPNSPGADLLIPLILCDGRISFLAVQVKLVRRLPKSDSCFNSIHSGLRFSSMFIGRYECQSERTYASLVLSLYNNHNTTKNKSFIIPGGNTNGEEQPPTLVIRGSSFEFGNGYFKRFFEDLTYKYSPKIDPYPKTNLDRLIELEGVHMSIAQDIEEKYVKCYFRDDRAKNTLQVEELVVSEDEFGKGLADNPRDDASSSKKRKLSTKSK